MSRPLTATMLGPARAQLLSTPRHALHLPLQTAARRGFRPNSQLCGLRDGLRAVYGPEPVQPPNVYDPVAMRRYDAARKNYWWRRQKIAMAGAVFCMASALIVAYSIPQPVRSDALDTSRPGSAPVDRTHSFRATGTTTVPWFPRAIRLPVSPASSNRTGTGPTAALPVGTSLPGLDDATEELTLLGLGVRTVSFLSIEVYVVGLYVANSDLAKLQTRLVKAGASVEAASTLVGPEVDALRRKLLDPNESQAVWNTIIKEDGIRSVVRLVPTRTTDYAHLRDGWVTGITARSGSSSSAPAGETFDDDAFGAALQQFKAMFPARKSLAKGRILLMEREATGRLVAWEEPFEPHKPRVDDTRIENSKFKQMGTVEDERISRLMWLGYLGGKKVSSEKARQDIIEGVMELATRPVGTVETQVI